MVHNFVDVAALQIVGCRRQQEDSYRIRVVEVDDGESGLLVALCDGMGGCVGGEKASHLVSKSCIDSFPSCMGTVPARLSEAVMRANRELAVRISADYSLSGMGTTIIAVFITGKQLYWLSVGDSPLWLCREGSLIRLNADHSMKPILDAQVAAGVMSKEEALLDRRRHQLRSALNGASPPLIDLPQTPFFLQTTDQLLIASDGMETLPFPEIAAILQRTTATSSENALKELFRAVDEARNPNQDNATAILVRATDQACPMMPARSEGVSEEDRSAAGFWLNMAQILLVLVVTAGVVMAILHLVGGD